MVIFVLCNDLAQRVFGTIRGWEEEDRAEPDFRGPITDIPEFADRDGTHAEFEYSTDDFF